MPKIDFYLIAENSFETSLAFVCRLLEKAYQQQQPVYVHTANETDAQKLDDLLWTFRDESFVPHELLRHQSNPSTAPILIGFAQTTPPNAYAILLNLTQEILPFYTQFNRIIEIVPNHAQAKALSRQKFRHYKAEDCEIVTHDLTKT